jgi:hypothetical protein
MHLLKKLPLFSAHMLTCYCYTHDSLEEHHQLLVVTTQGWDEKRGELVLYEREKNDGSMWTAVQAPIPVVVGKNGLAWGIGLHSTNAEKMAYEICSEQESFQVPGKPVRGLHPASLRLPVASQTVGLLSDQISYEICSEQESFQVPCNPLLARDFKS